MTEAELRERFLSTARRWLGKNRADGSWRTILDIYNTYRPLPRGHRLGEGDPWCAGTVSAAAIVTGLTSILPVECSCGEMIRGLRALGAWQEEDGYTPSPGDLVFYDWDDRGTGDNRGAPDHVGIVEKIRGGRITVIEGNRSDAVARRSVEKDGRFLRGWGTPDFARQAAFCSVEELGRLGILNTPDLWRELLILDTVPHLGRLFEKAAAAGLSPGRRAESGADGLRTLTEAGIVNAPEYWQEAMEKTPVLEMLFRALGGGAER